MNRMKRLGGGGWGQKKEDIIRNHYFYMRERLMIGSRFHYPVLVFAGSVCETSVTEC